MKTLVIFLIVPFSAFIPVNHTATTAEIEYIKSSYESEYLSGYEIGFESGKIYYNTDKKIKIPNNNGTFEQGYYDGFDNAK